MSGREITISGADGEFMGYLSEPESGSGPGIVVIQEIFGVNGWLREVCDALAGHGFCALCPDLFWRQEPGIQLTDQSEEDWARAFELFQGFDRDKGIDDLKTSLGHLRGLDSCTGKAGTVGFCLGGQMAYLMACRSDADASVGYYGVHIQDFLDEAPAMTHPLMLHIAEKDEYVPPEAQAAMTEALGGQAQVTLHKYPDDDHAFARAGGDHYSAESAALAEQRTLDFFRAHLA